MKPVRGTGPAFEPPDARGRRLERSVGRLFESMQAADPDALAPDHDHDFREVFLVVTSTIRGDERVSFASSITDPEELAQLLEDLVERLRASSMPGGET